MNEQNDRSIDRNDSMLQDMEPSFLLTDSS